MYCNDFVCSASLKNLSHFGAPSEDPDRGVGRGFILPAPPLPLPPRFLVLFTGRDLTLFGSSLRGFSGPLVG